MTTKKVKLIKPDHKYTTPVKIEIDQDFIDAEIKEQAINDLKALVDRWEDDDEMYTTTMEIEIDQEFINTIKLAMEALEHENCDYRR